MSAIDCDVYDRRRTWPRKQHILQGDPNVIYGPVCPAHVWRGDPNNFVRSGWGYEVYTRIDGIVGSFIPRVFRTESAAARHRRETIRLSRACQAGCGIIHACASDAELLATIRRVWG